MYVYSCTACNAVDRALNSIMIMNYDYTPSWEFYLTYNLGTVGTKLNWSDYEVKGSNVKLTAEPCG